MAYKRSQFLINKPFQLRFSFYVCSWLFVLSLVYPWIIYTLFNIFVRYVSLDPMGPELSRLQGVRYEMLTLLVAAQIVFLLVTFGVSVFMSHRIAGPLHKLRKYMVAARDGTIDSRLFFRKSDHFQELVTDYNSMMKSISDRIDNAVVLLEKSRDNAGNTKETIDQAIAQLRKIHHSS